MSDIHIVDFHKDMAAILTQLFRTFPRKTILYVEDISGPDMPDEFGLHGDRHQACFGTMLWLAQSGYLWYESTISQEALDQVTLTHMGFTLLNARATYAIEDDLSEELPPSVQAVQQTNVEHLRSALKSGSSTELSRVIQSLMIQARHFRD
ncbi:hypothetical protein [Marinibactrum halimedae]|uniref:Uncharacterized protein n=1 Tax=Marinibactrum halimedae TaxID=1444977 RepID=A0AA37T412_9GAMM|nr:hypothetical protein [Marinibactrum halimedae]MCD9457854.1 hypothetical protein [Marinibactrum halimedae]GLS26325.1 hypothetical protein GCM10007877_20400 [Marinibactrum halimedae]